MEYQIVTANGPFSLGEKVNKLLSEGWELVGSHQVVEGVHQIEHQGQRINIKADYSQTIIKK